MVEEHLDHDKPVVAPQRLMQRGEAPDGHGVGVGAVLEDELEALLVVPVALAEKHGGDTGSVELAALEKDLRDGVVVAFGHVVRSLAVVGVGSAGEQEAGEIGVVGYGGGTVHDALELRWLAGIVIGLVPTGVGACPGVEERLGGANESRRAGGVEAEIAREAEVCEGVPAVRATFCGGARGIA